MVHAVGAMPNMTVMRRFLLFVALMFWQGGFMFYGSIVVPVGQEVLGSHLQQGYITRSVTNYLNLAGVVALVFWAWEIASVKGRNWLQWGLWIVLTLTLGLLAWLHLRMDELLDMDSFRVLDSSRFYDLHRWYLIISTLQWGVSLGLTALTLLTWRSEDRRKQGTDKKD